MAEQERARPAPRRREEEEAVDAEVGRTAEKADTEKIDDLLDEIDTVLEENAEEFVKNYVQKGGE